MPGVPPDAANIVKRVFKGIFKRGKKNKQDEADSTAPSAPPPLQQQQQPNYASAAPSQLQVDTKAPQLPPLANNSPLQGATEPSNHLPSTHPLATGQHSTPQVAVPLGKDVQPTPGPPLGGAASSAGVASANDNLTEPKRLGAGNGDVSPPVSTVDAADAPKSDVVSAISNEQAKTDGVADKSPAGDAKPDEVSAGQPPTQTPSAPANTNTTATETPEPAPAVPKENATPQANGTSPTTPASSPPTDTATAPKPDADAADAKPPTSDEKISTLSEPPPVKAVRAAPGMSATSGPLEDFPEGGDAKD